MNAFTEAYIRAALWSSTDESRDDGGDPLDDNYNAGDISKATLREMERDCEAFQTQNAALLEQSGLDDERAGHNFWLSRNGHGAGFFDDDQDELQDIAKKWGTYDLFVGDDGEIHGSGPTHQGRVAERRGVVAASRKGPAKYKPSKGWRDLRVARVVPESGGAYRVEFEDDLSIQVHSGSGRDDLLYAMKPSDMRHERRSPGPERRREYQYAALMAVIGNGSADFVVDRDGDVMAYLKWRQNGELQERGTEPVEDPFYVIQGLYSDGTSTREEFGYDDEDTAISEARKLARSNMFEGDYVRVITRDGELVWSSEDGMSERTVRAADDLDLDQIRILFRAPDTMDLWGVPYDMRPGQQPGDIWRAGNTRGKWIWLGSPGWWGNMTAANQKRVTGFLSRQADVPGGPYEWVHVKDGDTHGYKPKMRSVARSPSRVHDYEVIDRQNRRTAGPFKHQSDARAAAGSAGVVRFVPSKAREMSEWVPPELAKDGISENMLEILRHGMGEHAGGKVPRAGDNVVYDKAYTKLVDGGYIVRKAKTPGLSSFGDYYVLTDKGADVIRRHRLAVRKIGTPSTKVRSPAQQMRDQKKFESGSGPYTVYFELDGTSYLIRRATLSAAKTEALTQAKMRGVFVTVSHKGIEKFEAKPPTEMRSPKAKRSAKKKPAKRGR